MEQNLLQEVVQVFTDYIYFDEQELPMKQDLHSDQAVTSYTHLSRLKTSFSTVKIVIVHIEVIELIVGHQFTDLEASYYFIVR